MFKFKKKNVVKLEDTGFEPVGAVEINKKGKKKTINSKQLLFALCGMGITYVVLLIVGNSILENENSYKVNAYMVNSDMVAINTIITDKNVEELFKSIEVDSRVLPKGYTENVGTLIGLYTSKDMYKGEILTKNYFYTINMSEGIENPVEVSFIVQGYEQIVGGTIREGDKINLYYTKKVTDSSGMASYDSIPIVLDTYVVSSFSGSGEKIKSGSESPSVMINIFIPESSEVVFNEAVAEGTLRVSKIAYWFILFFIVAYFYFILFLCQVVLSQERFRCKHKN